MSNPEFGHDHNKRDAWKKMSEWSHSLSDEDLNELFREDEDDFYDYELERETVSKQLSKFIVGLFGASLGIGGMSFVVYRVALALGVDTLSFGEAVIVTAGVAFIRYADAGVMKQFR
jgi:hypothetical protein